MTTPLSAYDYDNQQWVQGNSAKIILRKQLHQEITLLESPAGDNYFRNFLVTKKTSMTKEKLIESLKKELKNL